MARKGRLSCLERTFLSAVSCLTRIALICGLVQMLSARDVQLRSRTLKRTCVAAGHVPVAVQ